MKLTQPQINEFQTLYKARFGTDIDYETAELEATQLIRLVSMIQPRNKLSIKMDMELNDTPLSGEAHVLEQAGYGKPAPKNS